MNDAIFLFLDVPYCSCLGDTAIKNRPLCVWLNKEVTCLNWDLKKTLIYSIHRVGLVPSAARGGQSEARFNENTYIIRKSVKNRS